MKTAVRFGMVVLGVLAVMGLLVPSAALAAKEIKIGVIYPLTGGAAAAGRCGGGARRRRGHRGRRGRR